MPCKRCSLDEMRELRAVLQGEDGLAMWKWLDRLSLSPKDKPFWDKGPGDPNTKSKRGGRPHYDLWDKPVMGPFPYHDDHGGVSRSVSVVQEARYFWSDR